MAKDNGIRFSVYFHKEQMDYLDREAEKMGISQVQVSRMEKKILLNMRTQAQGKVC